MTLQRGMTRDRIDEMDSKQMAIYSGIITY